MADILWSDIVGTMTVDNGGFMGDLLTIARAHVDEAVTDNRLTNSQAGEIYTAMIPAAMQHAISFGMNEQLSEASIDKAEAEAEIAVAEVSNARAKTLAEIIKVYGFAATIAADGTITLGENQANGRMDYEKDLIQEQEESEAKQNATEGVIDTQIAKMKADVLIAEEQAEIAKAQASKEYVSMIAAIDKEFGYDYDLDADDYVVRSSLRDAEDGMLDAQVTKLVKDADIAERQMLEVEATGTKQRTLLDEEKETADRQQSILDRDLLIKTYENTTLQVDQHNTNVKQQTLLDTEEQAKQYEVDSLLPEQKTKIQEEIDLLQSQDLEVKANTTRQNSESTANVTLIGEKAESEAKHNGADGTIDKQIEKLEADIADAVATKERNDNIAIADIAIKSQQELAEKIKNGDVSVTYTYTYTNSSDNTVSTTGTLAQVFAAKDGVITSTKYSDAVGSTPSIYSLQKQELQEKIESEDRNNQEGGVIDKQIAKLAADIDDAIATKERNDNISKADIAIKAQQELAEKIKNGDVTVTYKYSYTDANGNPQTNGSGTLAQVFAATDGIITSTVYSDGSTDTPSIYSLQKQEVRESIEAKQQEVRILGNKT